MPTKDRQFQELKTHFARRPWNYGFKRTTAKGPARFDTGLIKPSIRREA